VFWFAGHPDWGNFLDAHRKRRLGRTKGNKHRKGTVEGATSYWLFGM